MNSQQPSWCLILNTPDATCSYPYCKCAPLPSKEQIESSRLRKDAERYRWLRDVGCSTWRPLKHQWQLTNAEQVDALIDGEMQR